MAVVWPTSEALGRLVIARLLARYTATGADGRTDSPSRPERRA
ncbi:hypothetical protein [Streptomyces sp. NPDC002962]